MCQALWWNDDPRCALANRTTGAGVERGLKPGHDAIFLHVGGPLTAEQPLVIGHLASQALDAR